MDPQLQAMLHEAFQAFRIGNLVIAKQILERFIVNVPDSFDALHLLAIVFSSQGKHDEAIHFYEKALIYNPGDSSALSNFGVSLSAIGRVDDALFAYKKSLGINPNASVSWYNVGNILCDIGKYEEALPYYEKSVNLNSASYQAFNNYGKAYLDLNRNVEALMLFNRALEINPVFVDCLINKGEAFKKLKRYIEALECFDKALSLKPEYAEAWSNKGVTLYELKHFHEAIVHYDKAISLKPDYAEAWSNKGNALIQLQLFDAAIFNYTKATSLKSDIDWVLGDLLHAKMKICDWSGLGGALDTISKKVIEKKKVTQPFSLISLSDDVMLQKVAAEIFSADLYPFNPALGSIPKHPKKEKIHIGYFSADFRSHPVAALTAELFELHNKNYFEIIAFSFGHDDKSAMRLRLSKAFNQFIDVSDMSDMEIAKLSREIKIDIAVDLGGFTTDSRPNIFAYRAAPIQVSYVGYLGTMGTKNIDYIIADKTIIPEGLEKYYTEKVAYLPSYQANDRKRKISNKVFSRYDLGLPEKGFVFCCFNNNYKILPATFDVWMRILKNVEGSVLFLYAESKLVQENLKREAETRGIDGSRLIFGIRLPNDEYLARYRACDLFLDTFPYNAGTTASDALWSGLPILTLMGQSFASRMAASLLNAIGLPELITATQEEYVGLAINLATNPEILNAIKNKLAANRSTSILFNAPLFTSSLEKVYVQMMECS